MGAGAVGSYALANHLGQQDETVSRTFTISQALETFRKNFDDFRGAAREFKKGSVAKDGTIRGSILEKVQFDASSENEAIIAGIADAQKRLTTTWNLIKDFAGISVSPARAQEVVDGLHAIEGALTAISKVTNDPEVLKELSRLQEFLARSASEAPSAPLAPYLDDFGVPRTDPRVMPRRDILGRPLTDDNIRPLSLGGGSGDDVLFGGAGSDAAGGSLSRLGGNAEAAAQSIGKLTQQGKQFEALAGAMADRVAETNVQLGGQADLLTAVGGLLPDIGRQLIEVFDSGTEGAEDLDRAVAAVGKRFLDAFEGAIRRGESLGDVLKSLARDLAELALQEVKTGLFGGRGRKVAFA